MLNMFYFQGLPQDELHELKKDVAAYFSNGAGKELNVASIYFEEINKRVVGQVRNITSHIFGAKYITDSILGFKFRIGPVSFFQVRNTTYIIK